MSSTQRRGTRFAAGLIIGASSGVGAATAARLGAHTVHLHTASRRPDPALRASVHPHRVDVRSRADLAQLFAQMPEHLDYLVNCAGIGFYAPLDGTDYTRAWKEILDTNILGAANLIAAVEASAIRIDTLVAVLSLAAYQPSTTPGNTMYSAAKTAARTLLDQYRDDPARRRDGPRRVVAVSPGYIKGTEFPVRFFDHAPTAAFDLLSGHACLEPDDVAWVVETALLAPPAVELTHIIARPVAAEEQQR